MSILYYIFMEDGLADFLFSSFRRWFYWFLIIDTTSNIGCIIGVNSTLITTNNDTTISKVSIIYIIMSLLNYVVINDSTDEFFVFIARK